MKPEGGTMMAVAELQNRRQQRIPTLLLCLREELTTSDAASGHIEVI
jgi:hypothetical protein